MTRPAPLSILAVSPVAEAGGAETLLLDVLGGLRAEGVDVALAVLGNGPLTAAAAARGMRILTGPALSFRRPGSVVACARALRGALRDVQPDVVLASHPKGQLICRLAAGWSRGMGQVTQLYDPPSRRSVSTRVAALLPGFRLSITDETAAAYRLLNPRLDPVVIVPGTDGERLRRDATRGDPDASWARAGLIGDGPRFVMTGRLQRFKGPFDFLAAAALVLASRSDARFMIVGPDSPIEPGLRRELEAAIVDRGLSGSVALAGRLSAVDLAATVGGATVLVHPAHREPFGLAVVEALALGTPVVSYATTGPVAILRTGGGTTVPVGDVGSLAATLVDALEDPAILARWKGDTARSAGRFSLETTVARYREALVQSVPAHGRSGPERPAERGAGPAVVATIGVAPPTASGVRDYGRLLEEELKRRGIKVEPHWLESAGDRWGPALRVSAQLVGLGLTVTRRRSVIWHYSPVVYGYRGLPAIGVVAGILLRARGCRVITVLHELSYTYRPGVDHPRARFKAQVQRLALRLVVAGSHEVVVTTDRRREALARRATVIPVFPTIPVTGPGERAADGDGVLVIGVPGYAGDGVRPDLLLGALPRLGPLDSVRVVLLGAPGPDSDDGRRWSRLAAEHGVASCVEFTGVLGAAELGRRLAACCVIVLVNEEGPSSRKTTLAAALAHGLPVVSLDGCNRWEKLIEEDSVRVVPCDAAALATALVELRDSAAERGALGARAASFAGRHMSLRRATDVFVDLLGGSVQTEATAGSAGSARSAGSGLSIQPRSSQGSGATA